MERTGFQDLEIYKQSVELRKQIFTMVQRFPKEEKYRLGDQLIRSTRKCAANIAEGHGRFHFQENIQFCRIARGSLCESIDHLTVAKECNYINLTDYETAVSRIQSILRRLNGYINYLRAQKIKKQ